MMMRQRVEEMKQSWWPRMEGMITEVLKGETPSGSLLTTMAEYHLQTGGKRLRAMIPLLVAEYLEKDPADLMAFGAACEMLHNATLVHDDLQDGDEVRRGRPTVWNRYGMPQAINLGDAMFYYTLLLVHRVPASPELRQRASEQVLRETLKVIDGQAQEFELKVRETITVEDYLRMVEGKTSGLFSLPMAGAAVLCGASEEVVSSLELAAMHLGVMFQIQDDVLDLFGDKGREQKGNDIREGKRSILITYALERATAEQAAWLLDVLDTPREQTTDEQVRQATELLVACGALDGALLELSRRRWMAHRVIGEPKLVPLIDGLAEVFLAPLKPVIANHMSRATASDIAFCAQMLPKVSRTFALSIEMLPESMREAIRVSYLLCRIVDTIEDDAEAEWSLRETLFDGFDRLMEDDLADPKEFAALGASIGANEDERALMAGAGAVFRVYRGLPEAQRDGVRPWIQEMSEGMREYAKRWSDSGVLRLSDVDDLERYCWYVAGTVGELLTVLFAQHTGQEEHIEALYEPAKRFGLGLQFVNILKDVADDATRDVCFLPEDLIAEAGLTVPDLLDPTRREEGLGIIRHLATRARTHLREAAAYTLNWSGPEGEAIRLFCAVPLALAWKTLDEVEKGDDTLRQGRVPKVTRQVVGEVMVSAGQAAPDMEAFTAFLKGLDDR